jgi:tetratricopeptide (TPR) repeat protein
MGMGAGSIIQRPGNLMDRAMCRVSCLNPTYDSEKDDGTVNDNSEQILEELKKISNWAEQQNKNAKIAVSIILAIILLGLGGAFFMDHYIKKTAQDMVAPPIEKKSWYDVRYCMDQAQVESAINIAESLIKKTPDYPDGHTKLGFLYLTAGNLEKAEQHFRQAYALFPSKENKENLDAILIRIKGVSLP